MDFNILAQLSAGVSVVFGFLCRMLSQVIVLKMFMMMLLLVVIFIFATVVDPTDDL